MARRPLRAKYTDSTTATFNALTGVANTTEYITTVSAHGFSDSDQVRYTVAAGNTTVSGLTNNYNYYIKSSNTTAFQLATTPGGLAINLTAGVSEAGHTFTKLLFAGVQEMSNAEISAVITPTVLQQVITANTPYTNLRITTDLSIANGFSTGDTTVQYSTFTDTYPSGIVGTHPIANTTDTYYLYNKITGYPVASPSVRPVTFYDASPSFVREMADIDIVDTIAAVVVSDMLIDGQGSYYLSLTSSPPASGTWTSRSTLTDKYANATSITSDAYTLWQKTSGTSITNATRPLKQTVVSGETKLTEMTDLEIQGLTGLVATYINTYSIGSYQIATTTPSPGTWATRGAITEKANDLTGVGYVNYFTQPYTQIYNTTAYTQAYSQAWTGTYQGTYTNSFTQVYVFPYTGNPPYTQTYTNVFSQIWTSVWTGLFTSVWTQAYSQVYTGLYTGGYGASYTGAYVGNFTGTYAQAFTQLYTGAYVGIYTGAYTRAITYTRAVPSNFFAGFARSTTPTGFTGNYFFAGAYNTTWTGIYAITYTGLFTGAYANTFTGIYATTWTGTYANTWTQAYSQNYTQVYANSFTALYNAAYTDVFTRAWTGTLAYTMQYTNAWTNQFTQIWTGVYQATYSQNYTQTWTNAWTQAYTNLFTGLTVQATTTTTNKTLYVRTA